MALRALARCCSHPKGSGWQSLQCQAGLGVSAERHKTLAVWRGIFITCSGCFHHQPSEMPVPVPMALAQLFPKSANAVSCGRSDSGNMHPPPKMIPKTLYPETYSCLISGLLERYCSTLFSWRNPPTNFKGKGCILIPISTSVPSRGSESPFQAVLLHLKAVV